MSNFETAFIECSHSNQYIFSNSKLGDVLFYPSKTNQSILIGSTINSLSCLSIENNNLGINLQNPTEKLDINGNASINGYLKFQQKGSVTDNKLHHGIFYNTIADENLLINEGIVNNTNSLDLLLQIPVYNLKDNKKKLPSSACLAKDLENLYPACLNVVDNVKMLDYSKLIPLIISSIQELNNRI